MDRGRDQATGSVDAYPGYRVLGELGRGASMTVLRVQRIADGVDYALKTFDAAADVPHRALAELCREAALLACVNHPGLVVVHEVDQRHGRPYVVMDLVDGRSLGQVLAAGPLSADRAVAVALELVEPLTAMHRAGLVHRDIKPDNIMIRSDGQARLIDFGLAARETGDAATAAVGTLMYCSPEQSGTLRRPVDARSDLYSVGVVLFECLTGRPPFASSDVGELLRLHAVAIPPELAQLVPGTPPKLVAIVTRLLAKEPDDRFQTGSDLRAALRRVAGDWPAAPDSGQTADHTADEAAEPFVGREAELARLTRRWQSARDGAGGTVALHGGSGSGKTRLLRKLISRAAADGAVVLHAAASADEAVPAAALRRAVEAYLRQVQSLPPADRAEALNRIRGCAGGVAALLATLSPDLTAVLGPTEPMGDDDGQFRFPMAVAGFLTALARDSGGLLLVVDDVQWLDSVSRRVLTQLAAEVARAPLLLVVSGRTNAGSAAFVAGLGTAVDIELTLAALTDDEVAALVAALLPGIAAEDVLARHLLARCRGNPFVVREYLRSIVDAGLLRPSWGQWLLDEAGLDALELPNDALGLLLNRLHGLDERQVALLTTASVTGATFRLDVITEVHAAPVAEVLDVLHDAVARGLVEARTGGDFAFLHVGLREALKSRLDAPTTAVRHAAIAEALAALPMPSEGPTPERIFTIAHHYHAAGAAAPAARARRACVDAGTLALHSHAPAEAVTFLSRALELTDPPTAALLHQLGMALKGAGQLAEATRRLEQAVELEPDLLRRNEIILALAETYRAGWRLAEGSAMVDRGLAELGARLPASWFVRLLSTVLMVVAAVLMRHTGVGFGTARGDRRRRCELICGLHSVGQGLCGSQAYAGMMAVHSLRPVFWGNRIGDGPQFVRGQLLFGVFCSIAGLRRTAAAAFARMNADPAAREPSLRAELVFIQTLAAYMADREPIAAVYRALEEHGRLLSLPIFAEGTYTLVMDVLGQGRNRDAARLRALAEHRLAAAVAERTALSVVPVMLAAAEGRHADAADAQQHIDRGPVAADGIERDYYRCTSGIFVLSEQLEIGTPFDEAVAAYAALRVNPTIIVRQVRITLFQIAMGRIAQYRAATGAADRSARLGQVHAAIRALTRGARDQVSRSWLRIARADLLAVTGRPGRALRLLAHDEAIHHPPAPLLAFEQARVRARAYLALDAPADARRQARFAADIAEDEGWPHRAGQVTAEFLGTRSARSSPSTVKGLSSTGPIGSTSVELSDDRRRLRALESLGAAASRILDPQVLARAALDEIIQTLRAERAFLFLTGERDDRLRPHLGRDSGGSDIAELTGYSASLVERVRIDRKPLVIIGTDHGAALGAQSAVQFGLRSIMVAPLLQDERLLGVVYLDSTVAKGIFTEDDAGILIALANHIANALETSRSAQLEISMQAARRQRDLADRLRAAFEAMTDTLDPAQVLDRLLRWTAALVKNNGVWLVARRDHGPVVAYLDAGGTRVEEPIVEDELITRLLAIDQPVTELVGPAVLADRRPTASQWTMLPLRARDVDLGVLAIACAAADGEPHNETEVAAALVAQGMTAYDNASLFVRVHELANRDELTGIANRRSFFQDAERALAAAQRQSRPVVAMMLDIDHFKRVNDNHGHPSGDDVIREVARRLMEQCRDTDIAGRYGGEEFVLVLPDADLPGGYRVAERLRERIAGEPLPTRTGPLPVTISIGLAEATATDDLAEVLARADEALYRAKRDGRNRTCGYLEDTSLEVPRPVR
jgi:diguanylate cyclase (GGDEF)-like protein